MKNTRWVGMLLFLLIAGAPEGAAAKAAENPLEPLTRLVGGEWRGRFKGPDGAAFDFDVRNVFEWGLGGKIVRLRAYAGVGGAEELVYEGAYAWHPTKKKIILQEYSSRGSLVEGTVEPVPDGFDYAWSDHSGKSVTHYRETFRFPDNDHYLAKAYKKNEDGSETLVVEGAFARVTAAATSIAAPAWPRALRKEVTVAAPRAEVWKAWTTAEGLTSFFGPQARVEAVLGGPFEIYFDPSQAYGLRGSEGCKVQSVAPMELFAFEWNAPPSIPAIRHAGLHTLVSVRFQEAGPKQTRVEVTHTGWGVGEDWDKTYAYFDKAWEAVLSNLRYRFAVGPVNWPGHFIRAEQPPVNED